MSGMICIEILSIDDSSLRVVSMSVNRGKMTVEDDFEGTFSKPLHELTRKELQSLNIKGKAIFLILPEDCCRAAVWECGSYEKDIPGQVQDFITANEAELKLTKDTDSRWNISGEADETLYGIAAAAPQSVLDDIYRVFKGFDVKSIMPKLTAFSLGCGAHGQVGIICLRESKLNMYVYHNGILLWNHNSEFDTDAAAESISEAVTQALNIAGGKRIYPSELQVTGDRDGLENIAEAVAGTTGVPCHAQSGQDGAMLAETVNALRGAAKLKGHYKPINYKPKYAAADRGLRTVIAAVCLMIAMYTGSAAYKYFTILPEVMQMKTEQNSSEYTKLRNELETASRTRSVNAEILAELKDVGDGGIKLNDIMTVSEQFKAEGINILTVMDNRITGYGASLDAVTRYVRQVSEQLGTEVDVENILQLEFPEIETMVGFEVKF